MAPSWRVGVALPAVASVAVAIVACASFGQTTSADVDAGDAVGARVEDAPTPVPDVPVPPDAPASMKDSASGCAHTHCFSFDGPSFADGFVPMTDGTDVELRAETTTVQSLPRAVRVRVPAGVGERQHGLVRDPKLGKPARNLTYGIAVNVLDSNGGAGGVRILRLAFGEASAPQTNSLDELDVLLTQGRADFRHVNSGGTVATFGNGAPVPAGWHVLTIKVEFAGAAPANAAITWAIDGTNVATGQIVPERLPETSFEISLGGSAKGDVDETVVLFDDAWVDVDR